MTDAMCAICRVDWDSDDSDEAVTYLACGHKYHQACLCRYCEVTSTDPESLRCPVCKLSWTDLQGAEAALGDTEAGLSVAAGDAADVEAASAVAANIAAEVGAGDATGIAAGDAADVISSSAAGDAARVAAGTAADEFPPVSMEPSEVVVQVPETSAEESEPEDEPVVEPAVENNGKGMGKGKNQGKDTGKTQGKGNNIGKSSGKNTGKTKGAGKKGGKNGGKNTAPVQNAGAPKGKGKGRGKSTAAADPAPVPVPDAGDGEEEEQPRGKGQGKISSVVGSGGSTRPVQLGSEAVNGATVYCRDCGSQCELQRARLIAKSSGRWRCRGCNTTHTQIYREFGGLPSTFNQIPQSELETFFLSCDGKSRSEAGRKIRWRDRILVA